MPVRPRDLDGDAPKVHVPGLRNPAPPRARPARILAGAHAAVPHQLRRALEAGEATDFSHDRHRRDERDPTQRLERLDHRTHAGRGRLHRGHVLDFVQIVQQRRLLRRLLKLHVGLDPGEIPLRPRRDPCRWAPAVAQQRLAQAVAGRQLRGDN